MSPKILLALQFWSRDKEAAMQVAKLIADLQEGHSEQADFLFVSRFDTSPAHAAIQQVARKFNVHTCVSKRRGTGWPAGCNDLFFGAMDWIYSYLVAGKIPQYKSIMMLESDSCPLHNNWLAEMSSAWDAAEAKVVGAYLDSPGPHINGNCMVSGDPKFLKWLSREKGGCSPMGGWDYLLYPEFAKWGAKNASGMRSWWNHPTLPKADYEALLQQGAYFLHGVKDDSAMKCVRERFKL